MQDFDRFYELAQEGVSLELNVASRIVTIVDEHNGATEEFKIVLSQMEERLISGGGVTDLYQTYGKSLFRAILQ